MNKSALAVLSALLPLSMAAQSIIEVRPEQNPEGRILSMEDVISYKTYPVLERYYWGEDGELTTTRPDRAADRAWSSQDGSIYLLDDRADTVCIAHSEGEGIVYGTSVSRNEFGITGGLFWAPDSTRLAFYRKDERAVTKFPQLDITSRTGSLREIRYPMNGMTSETISLGVYDLGTRRTIYLNCTDFGYDRYLTNISWSADCQHIFVHVVDRSQHHMHLNMYRVSDGTYERTLLTEDNDAWVEPQEPLHYFAEGRYIYTTDNRDGYNSLYLMDMQGGHLTRITSVDADVHYAATDGSYIYYTSAEVSPAENHLYRVRVSISRRGDVKVGKPEALTPERGSHKCSLNSDCTRIYDSWSSLSNPGRSVLRSADGTILQELCSATNPLEQYAQCEVTLGTVKSADGLYDNHFRMYKPLGFDPSKKYPVLVYVYGGPHSQMVTDSWLGGIRMWEMSMAQRGYIVYVQDNRGTSNRGAAYEKAINRHCGQAEMADQIAGLNEAVLSQSWADRSRVGVSGWSYGGYMTISLMTHYPEVFKAGACGGPVIDWKWYEIMYGERYMDTEQTNPEGFEQTSLLSQAAALQGRLMICQGLVDDTVVPEHSLSFVQRCIEEGKKVYYVPYPLSKHNVSGPWRAQMYEQFTDFFDSYLK